MGLVYDGDVSSLSTLIPAQRTGLLAACFVLLALMFAPAAFGQHLNAADAPCRKVTSDVEKTNCFAAEAKTSENELSGIYIRVMRILREDEQETLQTVQAKWADYRETNCSAERDLYMNGPLAPMAYYACLAANARQRVTELNTIYKWRVEKAGNRQQ
jgi:uncharacterized protein YecT (DUF1311 family)